MSYIAIIGAKRTAIGGFQGKLGSLTASELGSHAIRQAVEDAGLAAEEVDAVLMGIVLPAGVGQAPARQASLGAGIPKSVPATAVSKVCGSGLEAVIFGIAQIGSGLARTIVAGGMESMSNAPYISPNMRRGARMGHGRMLDHMFFDGLEDAYAPGTLMGVFAEDCATAYGFSREAQDGYALTSLKRAIDNRDALSREIGAIDVASEVVNHDEQPANARPEKIPALKPAFRKDGTVTAANASSISDGAAALVLSDTAQARLSGATIRARIAGVGRHAQEPGLFTTAPIGAARKLLETTGWGVEDVDLWEVNEAFSVVPMAFMRDLDIGHDRMNVFGGACALGHPIGASGARIVVTLLNALEHTGGKRGIAAICIGGGEALAVAIERE